MRATTLLSLATALAATALPLAAQGAAAQAPPDGRAGPDTGLYTNGRFLQPTGRQTALGNFPTGGALSPDGRFFWTVNTGQGRNDVRIMDVGSGEVRQTLPLPGGFVGVAFAPDGRRAYVSGEPQASYESAREPGAKGPDGDVIHVYDVDPGSGRATEGDPIALPTTQGGSARQNNLPPQPNATSWPAGLAVSPDGRTLVAALANADRLAVVDLPSRTVRVADAGAYPYGVAIDPQRPRAYVTNEYDGTVTVHDLPSGSKIATIGVGGEGGDRNAHPEGLVADPARDRLYVAVTNRDRVAVVDTERLAVDAQVDVGRREGVGTAPVALAIAPDGATLYSANAGEDAVAAIALSDRPLADAKPRAVVRARSIGSIRRYRTLRVRAQRVRDRAVRRASARRSSSRARRRAAERRYRRTLAALRRRLLVGAPTTGCAGPTRRDEVLYRRAVVNALVRLRVDRRHARGKSRRARAKRAEALRRYRRTVRLAQRRLPQVAACTPGFAPGAKALEVLGRIPTAAYPTGVAVTPDGRRLVWLAAKGAGAGPNPAYGQSFADSNSAPYGQYVPQKLIGRAGVLSRPTDLGARALTAGADRQIVPTNARTAPPGTPLIGPSGGASDRIKYVFYVVRENRTYDQVFGSEPRGDGDPGLQLFDDNGVPGPTGGVTPNAHALARRFGLMDHVYANSEVSIDGHLIAAGAYATDYAQKNLHPSYSGRGRGGDVGIFPVSFAPNHFVFDQAVRGSVPFRAYGEIGAGNQPLGNDGRPTYPQVVANTDTTYPTNLQISCATSQGQNAGGLAPAVNLADCAQDSGRVGATGLTSTYAAASRMNVFQAQFQQQVATGTVPRFNYLILPNDHTNGTRPNVPTPKALMADNDLGLGQLVELVSQSPIWSESAIFVLEDDSQDGADHVDAHRMPAFVISPWAKRGAVVSTRYDQYSFLRTAMMIVGLPPLSLNDALATPLYDAFVSGSEGPDIEGTRYRAIQPEQRLDELNPATAPNARLSRALPFGALDRVPQRLSDRILWQSVFGARSTPPPSGPNHSPAERARAAGAMRAYREGDDVAAWLEGHAEDDDKH